MKPKKLLLLTAFLTLLILLSLFKKAHDQSIKNIENKNQKVRVVLNEGLSSNFVDGAEIYKSGDDSSKIKLRKTNSGAWVVELPFSARARKGTIDSLLKDLTSIRGEMRSESKNVLQDFKLDEKQSIHVLLKGGDKEISHILLSPLRPGGTVNFVRSQQSDRVVATDTDILGDLGIYSKEALLDPKIFFDLKILQLDIAKVNSFKLSPSVGAQLNFVKQKNEKDKGETWALEPADNSVEIDKTKVDNFLSQLANLYAAQAVDPKGAEYGIKEDASWISISMIDGADKPLETNLFISAAADKEKKIYLKVLPDGNFYRLMESQISQLSKDRTFFLKESVTPKKA